MTASEQVDPEPRSDQDVAEALAAVLVDEPVVRDAMQRVNGDFFRPRLAAYADPAGAFVAAAIEELAFAAALEAAAGNPEEARLVWLLAPPHDFAGSARPGSRFAFDNPDRIYRFCAAHPSHRYELRGRFAPGHKPAYFVIEALDSSDGRPAGWSRPAAILHGNAITTAPDGTFVITLDADTAERANHLTIPPSCRYVMVRDTLCDWASEDPADLAIHRVDGPPIPAPSARELAHRAVGTLRSYAATQFAWTDRVVPTTPNTFTPPAVRATSSGASSWGLTAGGRFAITDDTAFTFTLDPLSAAYLNVMITNPWMTSIDYTQHQSSLNNTQVTVNADGTVTYVVSATRPTTGNWLDAADIRDGAILVRWEHLTAEPKIGDAITRVALTPSTADATHARALEPPDLSGQFKHRVGVLRTPAREGA